MIESTTMEDENNIVAASDNQMFSMSAIAKLEETDLPDESVVSISPMYLLLESSINSSIDNVDQLNNLSTSIPTAPSMVDEQQQQDEYVCKRCHRAFSNETHLDNHIATFHPKMFVNETIIKQSSNGGRTFIKILRKRNNDRPSTIRKSTSSTIAKISECLICGTAFATRADLRAHMLSTADIAIKCVVCDKMMSNCAKLRRHQKTTHNDRAQQLQCDFCSKVMYNRNQMRVHVFIHIDNPVDCDVCGKRFRNAEMLAYRHRWKHELRVHDSPECAVCGQLFRRVTGLIAHQRKAKHTVVDRSSAANGIKAKEEKASIGFEDLFKLSSTTIDESKMTAENQFSIRLNRLDAAAPAIGEYVADPAQIDNQSSSSSPSHLHNCDNCSERFCTAVAYNAHLPHALNIVDDSTVDKSRNELFEKLMASNIRFDNAPIETSIAVKEKIDDGEKSTIADDDDIIVDPFACSNCNQQFDRLEQMLEHNSLCTAEFICDQCGDDDQRRFNDRRDIAAHLYELTNCVCLVCMAGKNRISCKIDAEVGCLKALSPDETAVIAKLLDRLNAADGGKRAKKLLNLLKM